MHTGQTGYDLQKPSLTSFKTKERWFIKGITHQSAKQYREALEAYSLRGACLQQTECVSSYK